MQERGLAKPLVHGGRWAEKSPAPPAPREGGDRLQQGAARVEACGGEVINTPVL